MHRPGAGTRATIPIRADPTAPLRGEKARASFRITFDLKQNNRFERAAGPRADLRARLVPPPHRVSFRTRFQLRRGRSLRSARAALAALLLAATGVAGQGPAGEPAPRTVRTIDRDWTFDYRPSGRLDESLAAPGFDDRRWQAVALPHTWSTYETTGEIHPFIYAPSEKDDAYWWYGWGWYRKRFVPGRELAGKKVFVEFDGVQKYSRVYLNGELVGEHRGGYTSFSLDLTPRLRLGRENVLAVAVSNRRDDPRHIPPMTAGNFDVYGGIYRDVRLVVTDRLHVPFQGSAEREGGTFITTPQVDSTRGVVQVRSWVRNDYPEAREVVLRTALLDSTGAVVARMESTHSVAPGETFSFVQRSAPVERPHLWSPETPYVYRARTEVWSGGKLADAYASPFGFRWFRWDRASDELYLNGRPVHIHGINRHQEYPWLGDAMPKRLHGEELAQIREDMGMNFIRTVHYPNDPVVYDHTDRLGLITVEEVPNIKNLDFDEGVQEQNAREMVRRDRNHPSILFWSIGNETNDPADGRWVREEDSTRIIHLRHGPEGDPFVQTTHEDLEMENQLRVTIRGWYDRDEKDLEPENGQQAGTEEWQHRRMMVHDGGRARIDEDMVLWIYADHGADREYRNAPLKHVNPKGWVDAYRIPKYSYYLWKANWSERPTLFVHPHLWRRRYLGQRREIVVDANTDYVELKVNGRTIGRRVPDRANFYSVSFPDVPIEEGVLLVEGTRHGEMVRDSVVMAGEPARLTLTASDAEVTADRAGIGILTADVVDARGVHVYGADPALTWSVSGPGTLVGPARYESDREKHEAMWGEMYIDAPVKNLVRSTAQPGEIIVRVSAPGLAPAEARIRSVAPRDATDAGFREPPLRDAGRRRVTRDPAFVARADSVADIPCARDPKHPC